MKLNELRSLTVDELKNELLLLLKSQFGLRMQQAAQQLSNHNQIRNTRRDIARVKTILSQKTH
ncbi:LSU ribosomal protein L29P [Nitrosomonas cryotolerans]|uniref:Large ribosomal subunit protein uL29 n=1 Tax=Nitrosomonas cryotolerans ATCC 49181 TaxID=1131553 RepID=A0A1N6HJY3_9PROT|nr:50S ribosomal protein L29 [Nitrosomonas cryotolerans]SFP64974.1 LSU ribosomal protein L29P [Nitrosomonas cryotolerans]SIO19955.1 large subunit ribosomal protein L29 [Nitrosomonas cryotolerans ATCC 49181]